jgi:quercetin dioxygenase-like cupin family protein
MKTPTAQANANSEKPLAFFVKEGDVEGYHPANHLGTLNKRLIGVETVGAKQLEVVLGQIEKGKGALPHAHPNIEQVCYVLQGRAVAEVGGQKQELGPGDACFFPAGAAHSFVVVSEETVRVLVIYSPPYEERSNRTIRIS